MIELIKKKGNINMDKSALTKLNYGLYIVSTGYNDKFSACIVNTVTQITAEEKPKLIVAINKDNYTCEIAKKSGKMNISIMSQYTDMLFIGKFGFRTSKEYNKLENTKYKKGANGIPVITENVIGYMETKIIDVKDCNTHELFVLELEEAQILNEEEPLTYSYYHKVIKGKTPPKASTYIG